MAEGTGERQDHPYVAHYSWSADPDDAESPDDLTEAQRAALEQHAADRQAVDAGRSLRLLIAAPIAIASATAAAIVAVALFVAVVALFGGEVGGLHVDAALVAVLVLTILFEVSSVRAGTLLFRDALDARAWLFVAVVSAVTAVAVTAWPVVAGSSFGVEWLPCAASLYIFVVALWQRSRSHRLSAAAARLEAYSP